MAKGNMLLGYSRGSVGDVTFTKIKGQQVARARNRNPHNPRTNKQSLQRAIFAAAVKFYTRGNQNFYKFAFENKRQVESDYNAFMRENVKRAPAISREALANYDYPVFAPFIMAKGSLPTLGCSVVNGKRNIYFNVPVTEPYPTTIGAMSQVMIQGGNFMVGDIITIVTITSEFDGTYPSAEGSGDGSPIWDIKQFIVDPTDNTTVEQAIGMIAGGTDPDGDDRLALAELQGQSPLANGLCAFTCVHTRNTSSGLKCTTQELVMNTTAETAYEAAMADAYKQAVIASWQANGTVDAAPDAILQGSIAYED